MGRLSGNVAGELARLLRWGTATGDNDDRLLERFLANRDEAAFAALAARHGPMVLGVCRRILRDDHDVEDAFQATFLILARNARTIRQGERVGPWLHGVARRVAARARSDSIRRLARERSGIVAEPSGNASSSHGPERVELRAILDEELNGLPERLRAPLVLCYLEGLTHDQAASRLSQPVGTIRSRLSRGRERLRDRLVRRGVGADDAAWGSAVALEAVSPSLLEATVRASLEFAVSQTGAAALASAGAVALAKGVLKTMMFSKLTLTAACALGFVLTAGGLSGHVFQQKSGAAQAEPEAARDAPENLAKTLSAAKSRLAKIQGVVTKLEEERQAYNRALSSIVMDLDELRLQLRRETEKAEAEVRRRSNQPAAAADGEKGARYLDPDEPVVVISEDGHVVTVFDLPTTFGGMGMGRGMRGRLAEQGNEATPVAPKSVRLADAGSPPLEVHPRFIGGVPNGFFLALELRGEKVQRLAVFDFALKKWSAQDLPEPMKAATPVAGHGALVYALGRRLHAYNYARGGWTVLELPEGAQAPSPQQNFRGLRLEHAGRVYSYDWQTGEWTDFDTRVAPGEAKPEK